jgi:hypothetical protein
MKRVTVASISTRKKIKTHFSPDPVEFYGI